MQKCAEACRSVQKCADLVDLKDAANKLSVSKTASIQPRTDLPKFEQQPTSEPQMNIYVRLEAALGVNHLVELLHDTRDVLHQPPAPLFCHLCVV